MSFKSDLADIIKQQFVRVGIRCDNNIDLCSLVLRYFEMLNRRVNPISRKVHFSEEIQDSLGILSSKSDEEMQGKAAEAWRTVFLIRKFFTEGKNVNGFLSTRIKFAMGKRSIDGLLWDFGMHHFHLSKNFEASGFVERADYLLFAVITQEDAYFVDVRAHPKAGDLGWVSRDLLQILHSNWPELVEFKILRGVSGTKLTDEESQELRRKNCNHVTNQGGNAIAPIGGGMMADGSSLSCRVLAMKLLHEINQHQLYFDSQPQEVRFGLETGGIKISEEMEFDLVLMDEFNPSNELIESLRAEQCLSRDLCQMGFAVVERTTKSPIVVSNKVQP